MKKYFMMLLSIMFVATMSVGFVSCGDDDEEVVPKDEKTISDDTSSSSNSNPSEDSESETTLSPEEQKFVGYWYIRVGANEHYFLFLPDGKAVRSEQRYGEWQYTHGEWQYNPQTKLLATTIDMWQFEVTAVFDNAWTGVTVNTGRAVNASRAEDKDYLERLLKIIDFSQSNGTSPIIYESSGKSKMYFFSWNDVSLDTRYTWNFDPLDSDPHEGHYEKIVVNNNKISVDVVIVLYYHYSDTKKYWIHKRSITLSLNSESPTLTIKRNGQALYQEYEYYELKNERSYTDNSIEYVHGGFMKEGTYQGKWKK